MKTYLKPDTDVVDVEAHGLFAQDIGAFNSTTGVTKDIFTKQNDGWEFDDEDEDDGLW
ncbi:MAG: hypothetical protein LUC49_01200 [Prevotella sp.]|nr:hypothetical protein [Prevotella sp.]